MNFDDTRARGPLGGFSSFTQPNTPPLLPPYHSNPHGSRLASSPSCLPSPQPPARGIGPSLCHRWSGLHDAVQCPRAQLIAHFVPELLLFLTRATLASPCLPRLLGDRLAPRTERVPALGPAQARWRGRVKGRGIKPPPASSWPVKKASAKPKGRERRSPGDLSGMSARPWPPVAACSEWSRTQIADSKAWHSGATWGTGDPGGSHLSSLGFKIAPS